MAKEGKAIKRLKTAIGLKCFDEVRGNMPFVVTRSINILFEEYENIKKTGSKSLIEEAARCVEKSKTAQQAAMELINIKLFIEES